MEEKIYVVTAGDYSDYHIEAVFKSKEKAEYYCNCHEDCNIEEYAFSDSNVFTLFKFVIIRFAINRKNQDSVSFNFKCLSKEDDKWAMQNRESVMVFSDNRIEITLYRRLPDNYDEEKIRQKYTKVYQDLRAEILYIVSELDCSTYDNRSIVSERLEEYIKERFGIEDVKEEV